MSQALAKAVILKAWKVSIEKNGTDIGCLDTLNAARRVEGPNFTSIPFRQS
jgi:hypothetical protein